jgi:hypothetical protein
MSTVSVQTFYIDPDTVNSADTVLLTSIDLYFSAKPTQTNNASGIANPGVTVQICAFSANTPQLNTVLSDGTSRLGWSQITADTTAATKTTFEMPTPVTINTGQFYSIVVVADDPAFTLWVAKQGDALVGTNTPSSGVVGKFNGNFYELSNSTTLTPLTDRDLKFAVKIAEYTSNTTLVQIVNEPYEFLTVGTPNTFFMGGEWVYQDFGNAAANVTYVGNGTVSFSSSNTTVVGNGTVFTVNFAAGGGQYIVLTDGTPANVDVIEVASVTNNTILSLSRVPRFSNTQGVYKATAVAQAYNYDATQSSLVLTNSQATKNIHFQTDAMTGYTIQAGGTGYQNVTVLTTSGGTTNAIAWATTNSTGGIVSIRIANTGAGFTNSSSLSLTINSNTGSGANIVPSLGSAYIVGSTSTANAPLFAITNLPVHQFDAELYQQLPTGGTIQAVHNFSTQNSSGYYVVPGNQAPTTVPGLNSLLTYQGEVMSRTNEVLNPTNLYNLGNGDVRSSYILATFGVNTNGAIYESPLMYEEKLDVFVFGNEINNTAVNEQLPQSGQAETRHITTLVNFANNQNAEDIVVYVDAWKPAGTQLYVYAKIQNSADSDTFASKYWTLLNQTSPAVNVFSSATNTNNIVEYTYGFPQTPQINATYTGFTTSFGNNVVFGNTSGIGEGDLIQIFNPLFANTDYQIGVAVTVNATAIILDQPIAENSVTGSGMNINTLIYNNTAFNNINNDNVVRYYDSSMAAHDGYSTFALKVVMTAANSNFTPIVTALRAIGVSA